MYSLWIRLNSLLAFACDDSLAVNAVQLRGTEPSSLWPVFSPLSDTPSWLALRLFYGARSMSLFSHVSLRCLEGRPLHRSWRCIYAKPTEQVCLRITDP